MSRFAQAFALANCLLLCQRAQSGQSIDYSKEGLVIQRLATKVSFAANGAREWQQTFSVRVQSEAAVRQFGVLAFGYNSGNEQVKIEYVRVRKPDGSAVETAASNAMDIATPVAAIAPTYSDLRQMQIPVKALGVGDVLEYSITNTQSKPEIPGQFWYDQYFIDDAVTLDESLEVRVPAGTYIHVNAPKLKGETRDEAGQVIYKWTHNHLAPSDPGQKPANTDHSEPYRVQLTTFRNWEDVGSWWGRLAASEQTVTPALQEKAKSLTAGLNSDADKAKAIYEYVGLKYRYISISFGEGRFRPHSADEVFSNQYGDCKDKHILFATLLKAAGIQAWPALIGAGIKFAADTPSPGQFNHVITVIPSAGKYTWLDTTAEAAPFGLLNQIIRDEQALVIPDSGKPFLAKTPLDPPFSVLNTVDVSSSLASDGTLTGKFTFRFDGDLALMSRSGFRQVAPAQWQPLTQQMSYGMGYGGDVSAVNLEKLEDLNQPLQLSYSYTRKNFSDWAEHKITMPLPGLGFGVAEDAEKPKEPVWSSVTGVLLYRGSIELPSGFSIDMPTDLDLSSSLADYHSHYQLNDRVLTAERKLTVKQSKIRPGDWDEYRKFSKQMQDDQGQYITLSDAPLISSAVPPAADAAALIEAAKQALNRDDKQQCRDLLAKVEHLNPQQEGLWFLYSFLAYLAGNQKDAIANLRTEVEFHPSEIRALSMLADLLHTQHWQEEAAAVWRAALDRDPENADIVRGLAMNLMRLKRYGEVSALLDKPIAKSPGDLGLQRMRIQALLKGGQQKEGLDYATKLVATNSDAVTLNDMAFEVAENTSEVANPLEWARKSVALTEQDTAGLALSHVKDDDLRKVSLLGAEWDTIGWIYCKQGNLSTAEKFIDAAWRLNARGMEAFHLGEVYEKQGKHQDAIHMWQLALNASSSLEEAKERLRRAGATGITSKTSLATRTRPLDLSDELNSLRTIKLAGMPTQEGSGEYYLLISAKGVEDVQSITQSKSMDAVSAIRTAKYNFPFPDNGPEKIVRRGIVTCSKYTKPSCSLVFYGTSSTPGAEGPPQSESVAPKSNHAGVVMPELVYKVEPVYPEQESQAKREGTVMLSIVVDEEGVPQDISVTKPLSPGLDESAIKCVSKWRFKPGAKDGKPVRTRATVEVKFVFQDKG